MAQWNKNTQDYLNQERTLHEVFMCADRYGNIGDCGVTTGTSGGSVDAFGRSRTSQPFTLADYTHIYGEEVELLTKTVGVGATTEVNPNTASIALIVGTGATDQVIHQSRMYHHYMPGKSQYVMASFNFLDVRENTTKKVGYFDDRNGVFLQQAGDGTVSVVRRSFNTGIASDTVVNQVNWNLDPMDGTGITSTTLDFTKTQLFVTDFQWLGVGRIRCGFVLGGRTIYFHEFNHSNIEEHAYWSLPSLPIRCEVANTAAAVGITSMEQICSTVLSEGGYVETGVEFAAFNGPVTLSRNTQSTFRQCVGAIRLSNTFKGIPNRTTVRITDIECLSDSTNCRIEIWRLPDNSNITGGSWTSADNDSAVEYNVGVTTNFTTTGGDLKQASLIAANNPSGQQASATIAFNPTAARRSYIAQNIDSDDSNIFAVIVQNLDTNTTTDVFNTIQWRETR
jgi:hypothetical protein